LNQQKLEIYHILKHASVKTTQNHHKNTNSTEETCAKKLSRYFIEENGQDLVSAGSLKIFG